MKEKQTEYKGYFIKEDGTLISRVGRGKYKTYKKDYIKKASINKKTGYVFYRMNFDSDAKNEYVHRLVAKAFVPGYFNGAEVHHIDGNKLNNHYSNLQWVDHKTNCGYNFK